MGGGRWGEYPDYQRGDGGRWGGVIILILAVIGVIVMGWLMFP